MCQYAVHFRNLRQDLILIALSQTSSHKKSLTPSLFFTAGHFQNRIYTLFLGITDKTAGINDNHICFFFRIGELKAVTSQDAQHLFRIHQILIAAQ